MEIAASEVVPHTVTESDKMNQVQRAIELLGLLQSIRRQGWQYIVTIDESWFYWEINWEQQWFPEDDEPAIRTKAGINDNKMLLTIVWKSNGFCAIDEIPKGEKCNA
jgi:hypothetical protein